MAEAPLVSAVIATYNRAYIVGEAIDSILAQTYPRVEVIVVDDGSKDGTPAVLSERYGDRIRLISQKNAGPAAARNRGVQEARGDIITFLDSDDLWLPTYIERQVSVLNRGGASMPCSLSNADLRIANESRGTAFQLARMFPAEREGIWLNPADVLASRYVMFNQMVAIRRQVLERIGGFDTTFKYGEDCDLELRLSLEGPWGFVRDPLVIYREGSANSFSQRAAKDEVVLKQCIVSMRERALTFIEGKPQFRACRKYMRWELSQMRLELTAARMAANPTWISGLTSKLLSLGVKLGKFLYRRSPWYPRMAVATLRPAI
ncbi:MAG TPA: glycosyltransferase family A protein [Terriglobales bacterium]|nr:glycosyltransferase family A protein [Terriglobales bacterium]